VSSSVPPFPSLCSRAHFLPFSLPLRSRPLLLDLSKPPPPPSPRPFSRKKRKPTPSSTNGGGAGSSTEASSSSRANGAKKGDAIEILDDDDEEDEDEMEAQSVVGNGKGKGRAPGASHSFRDLLACVVEELEKLTSLVSLRHSKFSPRVWRPVRYVTKWFQRIPVSSALLRRNFPSRPFSLTSSPLFCFRTLQSMVTSIQTARSSCRLLRTPRRTRGMDSSDRAARRRRRSVLGSLDRRTVLRSESFRTF